MGDPSVSWNSTYNYGLIQCGEQFQPGVCTLKIVEMVTSLIISGFFFKLIHNYTLKSKATRKHKKSRKLIVLLLASASNTCYLLYNLDRKLLVFYDFQYYFLMLFLGMLVYYFAHLLQKLKGQLMQQALYVTFTVFLVIFTLLLVAEIVVKTDQKPICYGYIYNLFHVLGFFLQFVYLSIVSALQFNISNLRKELVPSLGPTQSKCFQQTIKLQKKLWMQAGSILVSQTFSFIKDLYFIYEQQTTPNFNCSIIEASPGTNFFVIDVIAAYILKLFTYFIPFSVTIYLFWIKEPPSTPDGKLSIATIETQTLQMREELISDSD